jgi:hypothetical protein
MTVDAAAALLAKRSKLGLKAMLPVLLLAWASPASPEAFAVSPDRFDALVNQALQEVRSDLRVRAQGCTGGERIACRFAARRIAVFVEGAASPARTEKVTIATTLRRGDEAGAPPLLADALTVLGATMMAFDPRLAASRRGELIAEIGAAALAVGRAERHGSASHYSLSFDSATGRLEIAVTPEALAH